MFCTFTPHQVKLLKSPKFDLTKLMDAHGNSIPVSREDTGATV